MKSQTQAETLPPARLACCFFPLCLAAQAAQRAFVIDNVDSAGEVIVLDPAGYGGVTLTNSVSIVEPSTRDPGGGE